MSIREITLADTELLIKLRLDFIRMTGAEMSPEQEKVLRVQLEGYYRKHIPIGDFIAFGVEEEEEVRAAAFMVVGERPAGMSFLSGVTGTILNVITYPAYRGRGYATLLVKELIRRAGELNVAAIDLNATRMGRKVYADLGFAPVEDTAMRLKL